ncbi:tetratricopeptide repeat protein [bacterium]|nr:tetratricopeptide repeat protein [bacterium]
MNRKELIAILLLATVVAVGLIFRLYYGDTPTARTAASRPSRAASAPNNGDPSLSVAQRRPRSPKAQRLIQRAEGAFGYALFSYAAGHKDKEGILEAAAGMYRTFCTQYSDEDAAELAFLRIAQCYTIQKLYTEAARSYDDLIASYPKSDVLPMALLWSGECHMHLGNTETARKRFQQAVTGHPETQIAADAALRLKALPKPKDNEQPIEPRATSAPAPSPT